MFLIYVFRTFIIHLCYIKHKYNYNQKQNTQKFLCIYSEYSFDFFYFLYRILLQISKFPSSEKIHLIFFNLIWSYSSISGAWSHGRTIITGSFSFHSNHIMNQTVSLFLLMEVWGILFHVSNPSASLCSAPPLLREAFG